MKTIIHIFTIYMLALSLVPCGDGGGGIVETMYHFLEMEHQSVVDHDQHSNSCNDDACSPFCICSCCSTVIDYPTKSSFALTSPTPIPETEPFFVFNILHFSFKHSVWQPPKFS